MRTWAWLFLAGLVALPAARTQDPRSAPWPSAAELARLRQDAQDRRLFASNEPLAFTLTADFRAVNRDRNPDSTKTFPATIQFAKADGTEGSLDLQIRTRGHVRRQYDLCPFGELRLEFPTAQAAGTIFDGQRTLKLGTHCRETGEFEQYVLREYAAYRINNLLTPRSFRVRLAKATYVDVGTQKTVSSRYAMFIEDDDDAAARQSGRIVEAPNLKVSELDLPALAQMTVFEYFIGNTDFSVAPQHNVKIVQTQGGLYPVPFDFDYSGAVNATYSLPAPALGITRVRDRLYLGPCLTPDAMDTVLAPFRASRGAVLSMYGAIPGFNPAYRQDVGAYLDEFYKLLDRPADVKKQLIDRCVKSGVTTHSP